MAASREKRKFSDEWEAGNSLKRRKTDRPERETLLCINNLGEILDLLKRHRYSGTSYYDLGLYLGLLPGTLDVIKENNKGDISSCLRECLKAWLQQADDVKSVGLPSYYSLIQALRKLGENAVADEIDRQKHPACVIFSAQCESNECIVAALPSLAILLHKGKFIDEMLVPTGEVLLKAVKEAVCADYHNLGKFAVILKESQNTLSVGQCLLDEYKTLYPADCTLTNSECTLINPEKEVPDNKELEILQLQDYMQRVQLHVLGSQFIKNTGENIQMQQVNDAPYLEAKKVFLEHFIELFVAIAVTPNRMSVVKQLFDSGLIPEAIFRQATEADTVSGMESGIVLMKGLKASINERPELISSLVAVLERNEAFISIAKRIGKDIPPTLRMYYGQVLYEVRRPGLEWCMRVIFGCYLNTLEMYVKYRFNDAELGDSFSFTFNDANGYIELCFNETVHVPDGWSIRCHESPVIVSRHHIEEYGNMSPPQFPECLVTITATPDEDTAEELNYPVTMRGVTSNVEKINIVLTREPTVQEDQSAASDSSTQTSESNDDQQKVLLTIRDLVDVIRALKNHFSNHKWRKLGLYLGLLYDDLNAIEMTHPRDAERCLEECLAKWLTTDDIEATWDKLAIAAGEAGETTAAFYIENIL